MSSTQETLPNTGWLDEELRKQKTIVTNLRDVVDQQQITITDQTQRILTLEDRLAKVHAQLTQIPELEESLRHLQEQMNTMFADHRQEHQKREVEAVRSRQSEREHDLHVVQELQAELQRFDPLEQAMAVRQAEDRRLNEAIMRIQQTIDDMGRRTPQNDDRWRTLADRLEQSIVRVAHTEEAVTAAEKAHQESVARVLLVENSLSKIEQQVAEMQSVRQELTQKQDELFEFQRRADRERSQAMTEWGRRIEGFAHQLELWAEQLRYFADQHERNRRVLREVQEVAQQATQQQDQLRQVQRIAEEQLRRDLREWRAEIDRRWAQEIEKREVVQETHLVRDDEQDKQLESLAEKHGELAKAVDQLPDQIKVGHDELVSEIGHLRRGHMLALKRQAKAFQDLVVELRGLFGEEMA